VIALPRYTRKLGTLLLAFITAACSETLSGNLIAGNGPPDADLVVLLHGLGRSSGCMNRLAEALRHGGFDTLNINYPSRCCPIETLAQDVAAYVAPRLHLRTGRVHFVTHSMGGIVLRCYLKRCPPDRLGRVVMLSPPNAGSEVVDHLGGHAVFRWLNGPAAEELGTAATSLPNHLGPFEGELGVITGSRSYNPLFSQWLQGEDDGKVAVTRARLEGMDAFQVVACSHSFIMKDKAVIRQVLNFLRTGSFDPLSSTTAASTKPIRSKRTQGADHE
jgi:pimeloyl-ACP methyl ester carboxylesterase